MPNKATSAVKKIITKYKTSSTGKTFDIPENDLIIIPEMPEREVSKSWKEKIKKSIGITGKTNRCIRKIITSNTLSANIGQFFLID
jgi:hypothetical protein